jgi:hypothetical protein
MSDICPSVTGDMASSGNTTEESEGEDQDDWTHDAYPPVLADRCPLRVSF